MCQAFPCILSLNTFWKAEGFTSVILPFSLGSTQALPGGPEFVWEAVSLGTSVALRRLGDSKRAKTV